MREFLKPWKTFILNEELKKYIKDNYVTLYHYSTRIAADSITLDPSRFTSSRNSWSNKEYNASTFPRVFFYLDKEKTEKDLATGAPFVTKVPASDLYDLRVDPEDLLRKSKKATGQVVPDVHKVLKALAGKDKATPGYEEYFVPIRDNSSKIYKGVHYAINYGETPVVAWFENIEVFKEMPEGEGRGI